MLASLFVPSTGNALAAPPPGWGAIDLGTLGGSTSHANAVNTAGEVVGDSTTDGDATTHAFSWTPAGGMRDLGTLGGSESFGVAVNKSAQVIAFSTTESGDVHAVVWQRDTTAPVTRQVTGTRPARSARTAGTRAT